MHNYTRLSSIEREKIFLLLNQGLSIREIGRRLARNHGSISREIRRVRGQYSPTRALKRAQQERTKPRRKKLDGGALRHYVISRLGEHWSPEQIAGRLRQVHSRVNVSYETIYQFIYSKEGQKRRYFEFLRKGHKRRSLKHGRYSQRARKVFIPNRAWIEARPEEATKRKTVGHLEGDLMEGKRLTGGAVSVVADRKSGLVLLDKLAGKNSLERMIPLLKRFDRYPASLHQTITFDNGTENVNHELLPRYVSCRTFFAHPYHSWEKGTVENTIGLIREFIPRGTDLTQVKQKDLNMIALTLNDRPRKRLAFKTPSEIVSEETGWCITN
ncbi:MAG: IS30 family transposase [Patescibacteria group bacterium]|nr:IS30 family transposase [Patescibacteria group bacterium]MCL5431653.1 IS30 family transposase [Patescibacteria group bacterium]